MSPLSEEKEKRVEELFRQYSGHNDNLELTLQQLIVVLQDVRLEGWTSEEDVTKWFSRSDFDNSGTVSLGEFKEAYARRLMADDRAVELKKKFNAIDKDGNGLLSIDELYGALKTEVSSFSKRDVEGLINHMATEPGKFKVDDFINFFRCTPMFHKAQ